MPKSIPETELAAIAKMLEGRPNGTSMSDLVGAGADEATRRSMQRRLKKLIKLGRARTSGMKKGTRYFLTDQPGPPRLIIKEEAHLEAEGGFFVPVSKAGDELQNKVRRPKNERKDVGYNRKFLSDYQPNITFYLSPRERQFLAKLGAVDVEGGMPAGTHARQILDRLLIDLSFNSSRLEGNTYSILDTHLLLEQGKVAEGKSAEETQMIMNHKEAIEFLVDAANEIGFNRHTILNLHAILSDNLLDAQALGRLRHKMIGIGGSVYSPLQTPAVIEECFVDLLAKADAIKDPFEQSFFASVQIPYLQPFADVNKRTSRLAANLPFIKNNLSPVSFIDVPNDLYVEAMLAVYELNRIELARDMFVWAYERSARRYAAIRQSVGAPDPFRLKYKESLRSAVASVVQSQMGKAEAAKRIELFADGAIPQFDRARFIEAAETELIGLHEGNFARFRLRPSEYFSWKAIWEAV